MGATYDEPIYIANGLQRWRSGSLAPLMKLGTMPLPVDVQTLPLYVWERWRNRPIDPKTELHQVLPYARAATLVFWWLLLGHVWLLAAALGGRRAALLAVAFVGCEPVLAAHAGLATTDVAVTACLVALVYHYHRSRGRGWWRGIAWPACWFALAILAKASGLVFGVLCLWALEADACGWWRRRDAGATSFRSSLCNLMQIGTLGMILMLLYCGSDWQVQASFVAWARSLPEGPLGRTTVWLAEHLCLFTNGGEGIVRQVTHNVRGAGVYLLGQTDPRTLWYYFPVLMTIKFSVPVLLGPAVLLGLRWFGGRRGPWYGNGALLCALVLLLFSFLCRVQIGVRFMFPLLCLAVIGLAAGLVRWLEQDPRPWRGRLLAAGSILCLAWTVLEAVTVWPYGLCYVNPLWGGTENGYRLVSDANYDWGQGLKDLVRWQQDHPDTPLDVWYFGKDPAEETLPMHSLHLEWLPIQSPEEALRLVRGRRLAVSATLLHGSIFAPPYPISRGCFRPVNRSPGP